MLTCTFFGSRNLSENIEGKLKEVIVELIEEKGVNRFYVGNQWNFDFLVIKVLSELQKFYSRIEATVFLAYMPKQSEKSTCSVGTVYPLELVNVPYKYRIHKRNHLMIDKSEYVVTCVKNPFGGASKFRLLAESKGKTVIDL